MRITSYHRRMPRLARVEPSFDVVSLHTLAEIWGFSLVGVEGNSIIMTRNNDGSRWRGQYQSCE